MRKLLWEVSFALMKMGIRIKELLRQVVNTLVVLVLLGIFTLLFLLITAKSTSNEGQTLKLTTNKNSTNAFSNNNFFNFVKQFNVNHKVKKKQDETLLKKNYIRAHLEKGKKKHLTSKKYSLIKKTVDNRNNSHQISSSNTLENIEFLSKIPDIEKLYITFFKNEEGQKRYSEKELRKFNELAFGVPVSLLPLIAIDDPQIKDLLTDKNNPFREIIEENQNVADQATESENSTSENTQNETSSDQTQIAGNTQDQSNSDSNNSENLGDYSSNDSSPVDSEQSGNSNNSDHTYSSLKGIIIYNNGQKFVKSMVDFEDDYLILDGATIPCSFVKLDGHYLIENQISLYDINGDYFSDYILLNRKESKTSIFLNFFNEFIFDKNIPLREKITSCCCFKLDKGKETILCGLSRNTNELFFYKLYPDTVSQIIFKTGLLNRYSGILSDDFNSDGFEDLLLSDISKNIYLYLKNIDGKEISPFLTNIPFTKPPAVSKLFVKKDDSVEFITFETKNSMDIFLNKDNLQYLICSMKDLSMDVFILLSDFNGDGILDLGIGHF